MAAGDIAASVYEGTPVLDGLDVGSMESPTVCNRPHAGGVTAINATIAVREKHREAMDRVSAWVRRFRGSWDTIEYLAERAGINLVGVSRVSCRSSQ